MSDEKTPAASAAPAAPAASATVPAASAAPAPSGNSLSDLLAGLTEDAKAVVLGEVTKARNEAKTLRDRAKAAETKATEYDKIQAEKQTAEERAAAALKAAEDRAASMVKRVAQSEIKALAANLLADPSDAVSALDASKYVDADGKVDSDAIKSDLAELLTAKPHWAKKAAGVPNSPAQGSSANGGQTPAQLTRQDLKGMSPAEIVKAQNEGRLSDLMGKR